MSTTRASPRAMAVTALAFRGDGKQLASGSRDHTIRFWDIASGRCLRTMRGHSGPLQCLSLSSDGRRLIAGSAEAEGRPLRIWKLEHADGQPELYGASLAVCRGPDPAVAVNGPWGMTVLLRGTIPRAARSSNVAFE